MFLIKLRVFNTLSYGSKGRLIEIGHGFNIYLNINKLETINDEKANFIFNFVVMHYKFYKFPKPAMAELY